MGRVYHVILLLYIAFCTQVHAQVSYSFTTYSDKDGLSQNTIMCMLQDHKGLMWFSTWNGINKFDGYTFTSYKATSENGIDLSTNRMDKIYEDKYGFIWAQANDKQVYRFNPDTEQFEHITTNGRMGTTIVKSIQVLDNGTVWLLTEEGALRVSTSPVTFRMRFKWYARNPKGNVHAVCTDKSGNEWVLSDKGINEIPLGNKNIDDGYFSGRSLLKFPGTPFYAMTETDKDLFFGSVKGRVWRYRKLFKDYRRIQLPFRSDILYVGKVSNSKVVFVSRSDGFCIYDCVTGEQRIVSGNRLPDAPVMNVFVDSHGEIWINQNLIGTVAHYDTRTDRMKIEKMEVEPSPFDPSIPPFRIVEDRYGRVWVHPDGGGFSLYDRTSGRLRPFFNKPGSEDWKFSNKIHYAYSDRQGNLWISTLSKGVEKVTIRQQRFSLISPVKAPYETTVNEVRALAEDGDGHIFVGVRGAKLWVYDLAYRKLGYLTEKGTVAMSGPPLQGNVYALCRDSYNNLWIATKGAGLVKASPQGNLTYKLTRYLHDPENPYSLSHNSVYNVFEDSSRRIWVATYGGGINYLEQTPDGRVSFINPRNRMKGFPMAKCAKTRFITEDRKGGNIWVATNHGAVRFNTRFNRPEAIRFFHYERRADRRNSLSNNDVHWIFADEGRVFLATFGGGLNVLESIDRQGEATFASYTTANGLPSDILLAMCKDNRGNIWISTENGISRFTPPRFRFESYTEDCLDLPVNFSESAVLFTSSGKMLFGTNKGFMAFNPGQIRKNRYAPPIEFSRLLIANQEVKPDSSSILSKTLNSMERLVLPHDKNIFTIQYAALDYTNPSEIEYAYRLKGFDENWNYVGKQRMATYTNLPRGKYVLEVRSTNADGVWCANTRALSIEILPSFWESIWAYMLYILLAATLLYIFFTIYKLKQRVSMEKAMTDMKLRFFTDISHELRTPLTLIAGPVEYILKEKPLTADLRKELQVVERNINRMLRLVNQILDFRKLQARKMILHVRHFDTVPFINSMLESFYAIAEERHIRLTFEAPEHALYVWADEDKFEKIILNILSNAFKYTPDGKSVTVSLTEDNTHVCVSVRDEGIGIEPKYRHSIFKRFENLADKDLFNQSSTGIGLSLARELADMHKATIDVESQVGKGSCFIVRFLKGRDHFNASTEFLMDDHTAFTAEDGTVKDRVENDRPATNDADKPQMLIVEDNPELRSFLSGIFAPEYTIIEATNGEKGLQLALKTIPDIIISDIMMPVKDGTEMVRELRENLSVSHIPVILLTAMTSVENRIKGLEYGADDYITKPFSPAYLQARVKNLLQSRRHLQEIYHQTLIGASDGPSDKTDEPVKLEMSPADRRFMERFVELVKQNMKNTEVVVEDYARELAVSRSVFFKKVKSLTGVAPIEFIRDMRIARAKELFKTTEYSVTEISYMVGFNTPRYFSKTFRQKTGMIPSEYQKSVNH